MRHAFALAFAIAAFFATWTPASHAQESRFVLSYGAEGRPGEPWRARIERGRMEYEAFAERALKKYLFFATGLRDGRATGATSIMRDPTLRSGDIYAAATGFLIFRGRAASIHRPSDFAPLPDAKARELSLAIGAAR
jgi:hypothetical protein